MNQELVHAAGGYGPPGGGGYPPGGGYGGPPPGGAPPGGFGGPPGGAPPGGFGGPPPGGAPPGGFGGPPPGAPPGGGYGGPPPGQPGGFGPPGGGFPPPGGPMMPGANGDVNTWLPLTLGILSTLCGCGTCLGFILGIVAIVFSVQAMNAKKAGDINTAQSKAKLGIILGGVGLGLSIIANIIAWVTGAADSMMQH